MGCFTRAIGIVTMLSCCVMPGLVNAQVSVTTYHNDNARTGQNTEETILTPLNVNSTQFGKLYTVAVDGYVYAQPLYVANQLIQGARHNVVYIATEHDSVYAIDADNGTVYWHISLIPAGATPVVNTPAFTCSDLVPEVGITGTPVIDLNTGTLYLVAFSQINGTVSQYLHAIDIGTSVEKFGGPVLIKGSAPGTAEDGNGTTVPFNAKFSGQRAALLLENGHVVIAWASHCDIDPWHGWVMSYSASTLSQEAVYNPSSTGNRNGVWMSGGGLASDANGNIFIVTGNGTWNGTTDLGDSIVKLGPPNSGTFPVVDYFTPYNQSTLAVNDYDLASGGLVLLPPLPSGRQLLTQMGKEGKMYLVDQNNMGKNCNNLVPACSGNDPQIVQEIANATVGVWGSPAYWNGNVYYVGGNGDTGAPDSVRAFSFNANGSGLISTSPTSKTVKTFGYAGPVPIVSANGSNSGILWALDNSPFQQTCTAGKGCQTLYAYDATNMANMLYNSSQAANNRDVPGTAVKYGTPIVANGKVYVAGKNSVSAFGLLGTVGGVAPTPTFSPEPGTFSTAQTVSLSDVGSTAVIHYTIDGSTPTASSPVYGNPLTISQTTTIRAIAVASGFTNSAVASATYTISSSAPTGSVSVNLSSAANVYAIFNNGAPVTNGGMDTGGYAYSETLIGSSIVWSGTTFTLGGAGVPSAVDSATLPLPAGSFSSIKFLGAAVQGNHVRQVFTVTYTDGTSDTFTQSMSDWLTPQNYAGESIAMTMPYRVRVQGNLNGSVYVYGYSFAVNSAKTLVSVTLPKGRDLVILAVSLASTSGATPVAPSPTFSPAPGTFSTAQTVSLSDTGSTAVIHYTIDGSTPTANSPVYGKALTVSQTTTVQAIAVAGGFTNSPVSKATYTISSTAPPTGSVSVSLGSAANVYAIFSNGTPVTNGGMDTGGYAYSENLIGSSIVWSGATFALGAAGVPSAVDSATLPLPAGKFSSIKLLGSAVQGNHVRQVFTVTYTDGTSDTFTQSMSDWLTAQNYAGESVAMTMPYRVRVQGNLNGAVNVYGYSFAINSAKTVKTVTTPTNRDIVVLAIDLVP